MARTWQHSGALAAANKTIASGVFHSWEACPVTQLLKALLAKSHVPFPEIARVLSYDPTISPLQLGQGGHLNGTVGY